MKKMKDMPIRDRPREKIATKGVSVLSDNELIEVIIGKGTRNNDVREISTEIVKILMHHRHNLVYEDIQEIEGIGPTKASQIIACLELGRRYFKPAGTSIKVTKPDDVVPLVAHLKEKRQEYLSCWKDLMSLKKYLLSSLKDYWNQNSNTYFLNAENERHGEFMQETEAYNWKQG